MAVALVLVILLANPLVAFAQGAGLYLEAGFGLSGTSEGHPSGSIGGGTGGQGWSIATGVGYRFNEFFHLGGEASWGLPMDTEQTEAGFGRCCTQVSREHHFNFWSGLAKARIVRGLFAVGGAAYARDVGHEVSVYSSGSFIGQTEVLEQEFAIKGPSFFTGLDMILPTATSKPLSAILSLRVFRFTAKTEDEAYYGGGLGNWTVRVTAGVQVAGR